MPILVKDYLWEETEGYILVTAPLKGVAKSCVDIYLSDVFLKVNYSPYLLEIDLLHKVDDINSTAVFQDGFVKIKLTKIGNENSHWNEENISGENNEEKLVEVPEPTNFVWGKLCFESKSKEEIRQRRKESMDRHTQQEEKIAARRIEMKRRNERLSVQKQMDVQAEKRQELQKVEDFRQKEIKEDIERWKQKEAELSSESSENDEETPNPVEKEKDFEKNHSLSNMVGDKIQAETATTLRNSSKIFQSEDSLKEQPEAPIRSGGVMKTSFTPRLFVNPARESQAKQEQEWIETVAERKKEAREKMLRKQKMEENQNSNFDEKDPIWLRDKGDDFYKAQNFQSAINAYTEALAYDDSMHSAYSNRAACYLCMGEFEKCIQDVSETLRLLHPPVEANRKSRLRAYLRRGAAQGKLGNHEAALDDYTQALILSPKDEKIQRDWKRLKEEMNFQRENEN